MARKDRDALLSEGEGELASWGVARDAGADALAPQVGRSAAADLAIAERLGGAGGAESIELLRRIERSGADKLARKEAKRSLTECNSAA